MRVAVEWVHVLAASLVKVARELAKLSALERREMVVGPVEVRRVARPRAVISAVYPAMVARENSK